MSRTHLLFDLDQTLMASNSAGGNALRRAFDAVPGARDSFEGLNYQGRTDLWIVRAVAERSGVSEATLMTAYRESYPVLLREELQARDARACPASSRFLIGSAHCPRSFWAWGPVTGETWRS